MRAGDAYVDVGTLNGYRSALQLLAQRDRPAGERALAQLAIAEPLGRAAGLTAQ